ncbi:MAG TPA: YraN family protein [Candidatus Omnitrophota bacterium]|nr:YraN family protein [Candidatus Omnitrophota bacterium]HQO57309.1 YraN family protein [Candidatus Omnitrophota bacterium]
MTKKNKITLGRRGEALAAEYLKKAGYRIVACNFRNALGEIDIVARDGAILCFVEVKTRSSDDFGGPAEAVSLFKQRKLIQLARAFLKEQNLERTASRFDVVSVLIPAQGPVQIELIPDAFEAEE